MAKRWDLSRLTTTELHVLRGALWLDEGYERPDVQKRIKEIGEELEVRKQLRNSD